MSGKNPLSTTSTSLLSLMLDGGGIGVRLECNSDTPTAAREIPIRPGMILSVANVGGGVGYFVVGDRLIQGVNYGTTVMPFDKETFTVPNDGGTYTHISGFAEDEDTVLVVNWSTSGI